MSSSNERGQYSRPRIGSDARPTTSSSTGPLLLGGVALAIFGLAVLGARAAKQPSMSTHEKEVRAWKAEYPGLPWLMWERARNHWERTRS